MAKKNRIKEQVITNLRNLSQLPADEAQLNIDVVYSSILDEICSVIPMESPRQIISALKLKYGSKDKQLNSNNKDVKDTTLMTTAASMPLDEFGYPTDTVNTEINSNNFVCQYKNILPQTIVIGNNQYKDDGKGNIVDFNNVETIVGTVNYEKAIFSFTSVSSFPLSLKYKFDINNLMTSRNLICFEKVTTETFAEMFQLDLDSALVLQDFKSLRLKDNIENIMPEVLAQQIDGNILQRFFDQLLLPDTHTGTWDATVTWGADRTLPVTKLYEDLGTYVGMEMSLFTKRTGVVPNVLICDPASYNILRVSKDFTPINKDEEVMYSGVPRKMGYLGSAKVFLTQTNSDTDTEGQIVITYKGMSNTQAACIAAPFIPVSFRSVTGAEGNGMINTSTAYSMIGFSVINPELIAGVKVTNINF